VPLQDLVSDGITYDLYYKLIGTALQSLAHKWYNASGTKVDMAPAPAPVPCPVTNAAPQPLPQPEIISDVQMQEILSFLPSVSPPEHTTEKQQAWAAMGGTYASCIAANLSCLPTAQHGRSVAHVPVQGIEISPPIPL
jgi:hypothetical protein